LRDTTSAAVCRITSGGGNVACAKAVNITQQSFSCFPM
jgi:hypothetical protein